ncbi:hypothetical protein AUEXF2481DRAFT_26018 [Aureobasidium subglaciale EXF-2481]|uniref:Uncharacterized protein n=1 Tax=Aureobasidium subglaciale (strain EXF-2481) TaxID=1043005 RepID=A0A074YLS3_AURSE|nr:uncharacterized protein AUEXF2481DRAFT_26018 [Aureobasidium subglaciale EXF-2481]KAI5203481.1 hypothetical protein E4T38_05059 [Aureobasidium subglaciale]KAI5221992.1 hypothetical protein E4T40_05097 [Aureobasidium subglaciale]KAI5225857.1 hypothetical protein E4T41_04916 [Aureobasidium subglaciale]KAI5261893.1 hypothetical protein E4T46_04809 [Aureobasidium subglaciale]KEQ98763.1 hypothetical protein AUEXF2481DRAFT_26018 [Aureobasidium subglaciale EXF-2481]
MARSKSLDQYVPPPHHWHMVTRKNSCPSRYRQASPARAPRPPAPQNFPPENQHDPLHMIDLALAVLEGRHDPGGEHYCSCPLDWSTTSEHPAAEPMKRERERRREREAEAVEGEGEVEEQGRVTPRNVSAYSQNSIQASLQENPVRTPANPQSSVSTEGTFSMSRAALWTRLSQPGPPTPTTPTKSKSGKG